MMSLNSGNDVLPSRDQIAQVGASPQRWFVRLFDLSLPPSAQTFNRTDALLLAIISLIALASSLPFFYAAHGEMPTAGDLIIHWPRMIAFDETLRSGVMIPRWLGGMNEGYGAATTLFYAPLFYYALSAAHAVTGDWPQALEVVIVMAAIGSGVALYLYARTFSSRGASAIAAIVYMLSPYHLIDLYHRGAMAELLAFVWMPMVMLSFSKITRRFSLPAIAGGGLAFALLILTHPPTAYLMTLSFFIFITLYAVQAKRWQAFVSGLGMILAGGAVAAFYALPAVIEKPLVNQSITGLFQQHMGLITDLLTGNRFEKTIGSIAVTMALLLIAFCWVTRRQTTSVGDSAMRQRQFTAWKWVGAISLLVLLPIAKPLVGAVPGMAAVAFVWRWLAITVLSVAILAGAATDGLLTWINRSTLEPRTAYRLDRLPPHAWASTVGLLMVGTLVFGIVAAARASNLDLAFIAPEHNFEQDFTPLGTPDVFELPRDKTAEFVIASLGNSARVIEWHPERRVIDTTSVDGGLVHIYSLMYPGWAAMINGEPVVIETHPRLKTMLVQVPPGDQRLMLAFTATPVRVMAGRFSLASLVIIVLTLLAGCLRFLHGHIRRTGRA